MASALEYRFTDTQDWFSHNKSQWQAYFPLVTSNAPRVLEIGSWERRSAVFLATELCKKDGEIICIDHFDLMKTEAGRERHAKIDHNLALSGSRYRVLGQFSVPALMTLLEEEMLSVEQPGFDWIYVDGSHEASDTTLDGELAWRLARQGAIVIFDDYGWDKEPEDSPHHPKRGIDAFLHLHAGEYECLSGEGSYQVVLRKQTPMHIGFLAESCASKEIGSTRKLHEMLGYGMNIALAIDSGYTMAAAVALQSIIETTAGRITVYVLDCGLSDSDRAGISRNIKGNTEISIKWLSAPSGSYYRTHGTSWAKLDLLELLPVERALYLDADVLVRKDLRDLWETDLKGYSVGAVRDVGYPMGHTDIPKRPYFNAGVLVLDLAKIRARPIIPEDKSSVNLEEFRDTQYLRFGDQDALNMLFGQDWLELSLRYNAQGLGTYAQYSTPERADLRMIDMKDPTIIHFTGPVHPSMTDVLNPHVQPYTAKPWGYAGSPGHPFAQQWFNVLARTEWRNHEESTGFQNACLDARRSVVRQAVNEFRLKFGDSD